MPILSRVTGRDERAALLPPDLVRAFDDRFVRSCDLVEEYVVRLALRTSKTLGLDAACADGATPASAMARAGLDPAIATVPVTWLLALLAERGWVERDGERYRIEGWSDLPDPAEIEAEQREHDPSALPSYRIAALAADRYPAVLRGEQAAEDALFNAESLAAWGDYFSNANPLYGINNLVAADALERALPAADARVLEIGGGLGSGAEAALDRLAGRGRLAALASYRFTEISPQFLRRAKKSLVARHPQVPATFAWLDIDGAFDPAIGSFDAVFGVNVMHVAKDLGASLARVREALAPSGALVLGECVRPFAGKPIYVELVFNLLPPFRAPVLHPEWRPCGGFLTAGQWRAALEANGFRDVTISPDIARLRDHYPAFAVAAVTARKA